ncbi:MAG: flagellar motor protein [Firmicutes bacterium]|nr:flagellar motor protein [Bacillota bacterium]
MDLGTIIGLATALGALLLSVVMEGGNLASLINPPAAVLVFGGTIGATLVCYTISDLAGVGGLFKIAFFHKPSDPRETIRFIVGLAESARREGLLKLEENIDEIDEPFLKEGIRLIVDGTDPALVRSMLETELSLMEERHRRGGGLFETAGGFAPTMGIIGTVMGLVKVLGNLSDPSHLGPAIATAFIATLYGIASANILWLPIANKLKMRSREEALGKELMLEGIISIQYGENPRIIQEKLMAFLLPKLRRSVPEGAGGERDYGESKASARA